MIPPTLHTPRLILRPMIEGDFSAYCAMLTSPRSVYMGGPYDLRGAWGMFCHDLACWSLYRHGGLMIDLVATGECVGQVGINAGPLFPERELGWLLYEGFEGKGYVTEAASAMRDWAFAQQPAGGLVSYIDPANFRSIAVAERLGAVRDAAAAVQDAGDLVFRHR